MYTSIRKEEKFEECNFEEIKEELLLQEFELTRMAED